MAEKTDSSEFARTLEFALQEAYITVADALMTAHNAPLSEHFYLTALSSKNPPAVLKLLYEKGPLSEQRVLDAALREAVRRGDLRCTELLLQWGADAKSQDVLAQLPFKHADAGQVLSLLLEAKADPQAHDGQGKRLLLGVLEEKAVGDGSLVRTLLAHGIDPSALTYALERAMYSDNRLAVRLLLWAGAKLPERRSVAFMLLHDVIMAERYQSLDEYLAQADSDGRGLASSVLSFGYRCPEASAVLLRYTNPNTARADMVEMFANKVEPWNRFPPALLHSILLYLHRSHLGKGPLTALCAKRITHSSCRCYCMKDVASVERLLDWHRRCPQGLDEAARELLAEAEAPVTEMEAWLAAYREAFLDLLGDRLPAPLRALVSFYYSPAWGSTAD